MCCGRGCGIFKDLGSTGEGTNVLIQGNWFWMEIPQKSVLKVWDLGKLWLWDGIWRGRIYDRGSVGSFCFFHGFLQIEADLQLWNKTLGMGIGKIFLLGKNFVPCFCRSCQWLFRSPVPKFHGVRI